MKTLAAALILAFTSLSYGATCTLSTGITTEVLTPKGETKDGSYYEISGDKKYADITIDKILNVTSVRLYDAKTFEQAYFEFSGPFFHLHDVRIGRINCETK